MANGESNTYIDSSIGLSWDTSSILVINLFYVFLKKLDWHSKTMLNYSMRKRKRNNDWVRDKAFRDEPVMMKHHTVPKHHGGHNSPIVEVSAWEHAQLHLDIYKNGYNDGESCYIPPGCKVCLKNYKTLIGLHEKWKVERDLYHDNEFDIISYYENDVDSEDILRNVDEDILTNDFNNV